jgi:hypothetical protein
MQGGTWSVSVSGGQAPYTVYWFWRACSLHTSGGSNCGFYDLFDQGVGQTSATLAVPSNVDYFEVVAQAKDAVPVEGPTA